MIGRYHRKATSLTRIREAAGTDTSGTNIEGLIQGARSLGFSARGFKGTMDEFETHTPVPFIAHVQQNGLLHFVVVYRIGRRTLGIVDPAHGRVRMTRDEFAHIWSGIFVVLIPTPDFRPGSTPSDRPLLRFAPVLKPHVTALIEVSIASVLLLVLGLGTFFYFRFLVDHVVPGAMNRALVAVSLAMVGVTVFRSVLGLLRGLSLAHIGNRIDLSIVFAYFHHVLHLPMSFFDRRRVGEIMTRLQDISAIRDVLSGVTLSVVMDTVLVFGIGVFLAMQSPILTLVALAPVPVAILIVLSLVHPFERNHRRYMALDAAGQSHITEVMSGMFTIKSMNAEELSFVEGEQRLVEAIRQDFRLEVFGTVQRVALGFVDGLGQILIFWIGTGLILKNEITLGQLISFNALAGYFTSSLENLFTLQPALQGASVAAQRIIEILDLPPESESVPQTASNRLEPESIHGSIEFRNVDFRYGTRRPVLSAVGFSVAAGERIGIVGTTGSGKSTVAKLLLKMYTPTAGSIHLDGHNIQDIRTHRLREIIGYVPQELTLFSGTIADNIALHNPGARFEQVIEAAVLAGAHEFIMELPERYQEMVQERGSSLSGGEKQRIALARALLGGPRILVLDEATSALDVTTEQAVQSVLDELSRMGVTILIIAHRMSTVATCDRILVLESGKTTEQGTHAELLETGGRYAELWSAQSPV